MKRLLCVLLSLCLIIGLSACSGSTDSDEIQEYKSEIKKLKKQIKQLEDQLSVYEPSTDSSDDSTPSPPSSGNTQTGPQVGGEIGDLCYDYELDVYGQDKTIKISDSRGKVTLVNFWYIYCSSCVKELETEFPKVNDKYGDDIEILAIHSYQEYNCDIQAFINDNFPDEDFTFCRDGEDEKLFRLLGGDQAWPITVILDEEGIIVETICGGTTADELSGIIDGILGEME